MVLGPRDAQAVGDEVSAGRLYLELAHQDGQPTLSAAQQADTKAAMRNLRTRFPNVEAVARSETPDELGGLPAHLRSRQKAMRDEAGLDINGARAERERHRKARGRDDEPKAPTTPKPKPSSSRAPRGAHTARRGVDATLARAAVRGRRRARRSYRQATPAGVTSWGRLAMQSIGTAVGLSLLYLLVRDAERHRNGGAVGVASTAFAQAFSHFLSPATDVFGGGGAVPVAATPTDPVPTLPSPAGGPTPLPPRLPKPGSPNRLATYPH